MTFLRHIERTRMLVQNRRYMLSEGRSVEAHR
jgi:GTPase involved in cell partitioning and DNA repair